jgi:hypothetical protein
VDFVKTASWNVLISVTIFECSMSGFNDVYIFLKPLKTIKVLHFMPNGGHTQSQIGGDMFWFESELPRFV